MSSPTTNPHGTVSLTQVWDAAAVRYSEDTGLPASTGRWRDLRTTDLPAAGGGYTPSIFVITGDQLAIPAGVKSWSVGIVSGHAFINGSGPLAAKMAIDGGQYDGRFVSSAPIVVGCTGTVAEPCNVIVFWES